jgi:hypothetical protein
MAAAMSSVPVTIAPHHITSDVSDTISLPIYPFLTVPLTENHK